MRERAHTRETASDPFEKPRRAVRQISFLRKKRKRSFIDIFKLPNILEQSLTAERGRTHYWNLP